MKTIKILIWLLAIITISCTEEKIASTNGQTNVQEETYNLLNFNSAQEFLDYNIDNSKRAENHARLSSTSFISFDEVYLQALSELSLATDNNEEAKILQKYSDVIVLRDSTYTPIIEPKLYRDICNRDRIYQTGEFINKVVDSRSIVSTKKEFYNELLKINSITNLNSEKFNIIQYSQSANAVTNGRTQSSCGNSYSVDYFQNYSGCSGDRRVVIEAKAYLAFVGFIDGFQVIYPWVSIEILGLKRNSFCNWKRYTTILSSRNVSFACMSYQNISTDPVFTTSVRVPFTFSHADYTTTSDAIRLTVFNANTGTSIVGENPYKDGPYEFTQIRIEASSRGTDNHWASINCQ